MFKSGNTIITEALNSFEKIKEQLNAGIEKSRGEISKTTDKLDQKREKFEAFEATSRCKLADNRRDIEQANLVKQNLEKILTGKL